MVSSVCCMLQETATTCRERCGGQGYLSCNRFGAILGFSHAGMTAEGDNRCASLHAVCIMAARLAQTQRFDVLHATASASCGITCCMVCSVLLAKRAAGDACQNDAVLGCNVVTDRSASPGKCYGMNVHTCYNISPLCYARYPGQGCSPCCPRACPANLVVFPPCYKSPHESHWSPGEHAGFSTAGMPQS